MSDIRPFIIRRPIGGDTLRPTTGFKGALRFGPEDVAFDAVKGTTLSGTPVGYDTTTITVQVPASVPNRGQMVLVRGGFGYPTTPLDGVQVWSNPDNLGAVVTTQFNQQVRDTPLTGGRWYYYTLFVNVVTLPYPVLGSWQIAAHVSVLVPRDYQHAEKLFALIPPFYQGQDDRQAADGRNGPLRKFIRTIGYDADYNRTLLDGVLNIYSPDFAPLLFTQHVGTNLGLDTEDAIGGARFRTLVGRIWDLDSARGTGPGLQQFIYAASNYRTVVLPGVNMLLTPDDAEFVNGVGHWEAYTNPHVVDMTDVPPVPDTHPPVVDLSHMFMRKYALTDILPPAGFGSGIMEIIELSTFAYTGKYGVAGTFDGPQAPFANLAALSGASPPVVIGVVANYYTNIAASWWNGDFVVLGDTSHASWNGTTWVTGNAILARPVRTGSQAGTPGWQLPLGALPPANFAALQSIQPATSAVPATAWKAGDYVVLGDGTQAHADWRKSGLYRFFEWQTGPGVLTLPATIGQLGPIAGYLTTWQVADGNFGVAPASLAALQASVPMIVGRNQDDLYRPWRPSATYEAYEFLYCYDNAKVAWIGWKRDNSSATQQVGVAKGGPVTMDRLASVSTTAPTPWADAGARAASTMTSAFSGTYAGTSGTISYAPGWTKMVFPATGISMTGWTNPSSDRATFVPTATADARIHARIQSSVVFPVGTAIALFINNVELGRVTLDVARGNISIHADVTVTAGQTVDARVFNPTAAAFTADIVNTNMYWSPLLRADPRPAYAANQTWVVPAGVTQRRHIVISMAPNSSCPGDFYLMKNGVPVANGYMGSDFNAATYLEADINVVPGDVIWIGIGIWYAPYGAYMSVLSGKAPTLHNTRWETVP